MALSANDLAQIEGLLAAPDADMRAFHELRLRFPELSVTPCDASDLDTESPFREYGRFNLYLVDGTDHCWRLTSDPELATGLVLARNKVVA